MDKNHSQGPSSTVAVEPGDQIEEIRHGRHRTFRTVIEDSGGADGGSDSSESPPASSDDVTSTGGKSSEYKASGKTL